MNNQAKPLVLFFNSVTSHHAPPVLFNQSQPTAGIVFLWLLETGEPSVIL